MYLIVNPKIKRITMEAWDEQEFLGDYEYQIEKDLSQEFLGWIEEFLDAHATYKEDLKGIIVTRGPGSFTMLRIVISSLNAMAYALNIPILGITKSEFLAYRQAGINQDQILKYVKQLEKAKGFAKPVVPFYNEKPKITKPTQ